MNNAATSQHRPPTDDPLRAIRDPQALREKLGHHVREAQVLRQLLRMSARLRRQGDARRETKATQAEVHHAG